VTLAEALAQGDGSARLQAAMDAGTRPDPSFIPVLIARCEIEPDFSVREMLTWALVRHPADLTLPPLIDELGSEVSQARSQALHTLSKIGDERAWPAIAPALLFDSDDTVARTAWRAAVAVAPEAERAGLAATLATLLGRGDRDVRMSLARALAALAPESDAVLRQVATSADAAVRVHALATLRIVADPDEAWETAEFEARKALPIE
jgi:HEAT repeat protein